MVYLSGFFSFFLLLLISFPIVSFLVSQSIVPIGSGYIDSYLVKVILFTVGQALLSALLSGIVGFFGAFLYSEWRFPGRLLFWRAILMFFNIPSLFVVFAVSSFWGRSGPLFPWLSAGLGDYSIFGLTGILMAHTLMNFPIYVKWVGLALSERSRELECAALSLGATRFQVFFNVTLFQIRHALLSAFGTSFLLCSTSFVVILILGGGPKFQTLEVSLYEAIKMNFDPARAAILACLQILLGLLIFFLFVKPWGKRALGVRERKSLSASFESVFSPRSLWSKRIVLVLYAAIVVMVAVGPLLTWAALGVMGIPKLNWTGEVFPALGDTLWLAFGAASTSLFFAIAVAYFAKHTQSQFLKRFISVGVNIPLFVSGIVISTSILYSVSFSVETKVGVLSMIALIQGLLSFPFVVRPITEAWERLPREWYYASRSAGASQLQCFRWIELPNLLRPLGVALATGIGFSMGELGVVLVLYSGEVSPLSMAAYQALGRYRFSEGYAMGLILLSLMALLFSLAERWENK